VFYTIVTFANRRREMQVENRTIDMAKIQIK